MIFNKNGHTESYVKTLFSDIYGDFIFY